MRAGKIAAVAAAAFGLALTGCGGSAKQPVAYAPAVYHTQLCRDGGPLDAHPQTYRWP